MSDMMDIRRTTVKVAMKTGCQGCVFWHPTNSSSSPLGHWGKCKRFPPQLPPRDNSTFYDFKGEFPRTFGGNWRGEFITWE